MRPITPDERAAFAADAAELISVSNRAWARRSNSDKADHHEKDFASYVGALDVAETKLLAVECLRRLMRGDSRTREYKIAVVAWVAQAGKTLMTEGYGMLAPNVIPGVHSERLLAQKQASDKSRPSKKARRK